MKKYYADYASHFARMYFLLTKVALTEAEKIGFLVAKSVIESMTDYERKELERYYARHEINVNWSVIRKYEKTFAKKRGLI